jgi:hypothetical protein
MEDPNYDPAQYAGMGMSEDERPPRREEGDRGGERAGRGGRGFGDRGGRGGRGGDRGGRDRGPRR